MATFLRNALPPTMSADMTAETPMESHCCQLSSRMVSSLTTIAAPQEPEMMLMISPTTSLQTLATFSLFLTSHIAVFAPYSFFDAMETMGVMSQEVTATPMPSKSMPSMTMKSRSMTVTMMLLTEAVISVRKLMNAESTRVAIVALIAQRLRFFLRFVVFLEETDAEDAASVTMSDGSESTAGSSAEVFSRLPSSVDVEFFSVKTLS